MATAPSITFLAAASGCTAIVARLDGGSPGKFAVYDGTKPATADTAITSQVKLVEFTLSNPAFGGPVSSTGAVATLLSVPKTNTAVATGTASWFRATDSTGLAVIDGSVGTASADAIIDNTSIASGQTVLLNSWTFKVPIS